MEGSSVNLCRQAEHMEREMRESDDDLVRSILYHDIIQLEEEIEFERDLNRRRDALLERIRRVAYLIIDEG